MVCGERPRYASLVVGGGRRDREEDVEMKSQYEAPAIEHRQVVEVEFAKVIVS